jgi:hypothetical protein
MNLPLKSNLPYNIVVVVEQKQDWKDVGRFLRKQLLTRHFLVHFLIIATMQWWMSPVIYLYLRWFQFDQYGILAWVQVIILPLVFLATLVWMFVYAFQASKPVKEARKRVNNYERGAEQDLAAARAIFQKNFSMKPMAYGMLCLFLVVPSAVALTLLGMIRNTQLRSPHHNVDLSPRAELRRTIKNFERRGIFTPLKTD